MFVSLLVRTDMIGDDIERVVVSNGFGKRLSSPSLVYYDKGWNPAAVGIVGACFV